MLLFCKNIRYIALIFLLISHVKNLYPGSKLILVRFFEKAGGKLIWPNSLLNVYLLYWLLVKLLWWINNDNRRYIQFHILIALLRWLCIPQNLVELGILFQFTNRNFLNLQVFPIKFLWCLLNSLHILLILRNIRKIKFIQVWHIILCDYSTGINDNSI
jgi:hypothetical protein